ncbi:MAG TPA: alcohol dehydrogenase catalytic domain-containing protein [Pseudonocardiaceae bacterium]|jgi:propanol-preferring alcohol dehydrogenase
MNAALLKEFGSPLVLTHLDRPQPGPGEALIRVRAAGLCGTDLKVAGGVMRPDLALPVVIGHEVAGEVVSTPDGSLPPGTRVACYPYLPCGDCASCARGDTNTCADIQLVGLDRQGGLAEYLAVPATSLIPFAEHIDFAAAAVSMDAVATTWHALYGRGRIAAEDRVVVIGAGGLGLNGVQIAVGAGARVAVVDRNPLRREIVLDYGADRAVAFEDTDSLRDWSAQGADLVLEATGSRAGFDTAVSLLAGGGRVVCCGHSPGLEFGLESTGMVGRELSVLGSRGSTFADAAAALAAVERGDVRPRIDSVYALDQAADAFTLLASRQALGRVVIEI